MNTFFGGPIRPYLGLNIHLGNIGNGFKPFSHPKMQSETPRTSLRKIHIYSLQKYVYFFRGYLRPH